MDKKRLLEFIENLPDNLEVQPLEYNECKIKENEWESQHRSTEIGGVYHQTVDNILIFKTKFEGEFKRSQQNKEGNFFNLRRIE